MPYTELYHHGILGQKWGVRRFQNKDGTLTEAGKKRYSGVVNEKIDRMQMDTIKKGTTINRVAKAGETLDSKRKRVSITPNDKAEYEYSMSDYLIDDLGGGDFGAYEYKAKKDLKVASGKDVTDYAINKYGDEVAKQIYQTLKSLGYMDSDMYFDKTKKAGKEISDMEFKYLQAVGKIMNKNLDDIADTYRKKGYDAMVDIEDWGYTEFPLVILNPKDSMRLEKYNEFNWR